MAPRPVPGTIIILDVGENTSEEKDGKSFFQSARDCVALIIERKILSGSKNLLGILLIGCKSSKTEDSEEVAFTNIDWLVKLQEPTWEMIRNLPKEPTKYKGDWLDSFFVATDYAINGIFGIKISSLKFILITNFKEPTIKGNKKIKKILQSIQDQTTYEISVIGTDIYEENSKNDDLELVKQLVENTDGTSETFENTMRYLLFHKKKSPDPSAWNVDLCIGPHLKIPISGYIRIEDVSAVGPWKKSIRDPVTLEASTTEAVVKPGIKYYDADNKSTIESSDVIDAYQFGEQLIPIDKNEKSLYYKSGAKGLHVYGFTEANKIQWQNLSGSNGKLYYIFGRKGDKNAQNTIRCLVECLEIMKLAGIVRKVHYDNMAPKMFALMPVIDGNNYICLSLIPICFKQEIKYLSFPPINLKKYSCTDEQVNAFKDLIEAMDLTKAYDDTFDDKEAFPIAQAFSPTVQFILDSIAFRAMNPKEPLPQPRVEIKTLLNVPPLLEEQSKKPLEKIKQLFSLKEVEVPSKKPRLSTNNTLEPADKAESSSTNILQPENKDFIPSVTLPVADVTKVQKIETVDPVGNLTALLNEGKTLSELAAQMTDVIESLINFSFGDNYNRAVNAWMHFRKEFAKDNPTHYNVWLQKFKSELKNRNKDDVLNIICEQKLDYILKSENELSTFDNELSHVESQMYENDTIPNFTEVKIDNDVNDMFDEM